MAILENVITKPFEYRYPAKYRFATEEEFTFDSGRNLSEKELVHLMRCLEDGRIKIIPVPKEEHAARLSDWLNFKEARKLVKGLISLSLLIAFLLIALIFIMLF